MPPTAPPPWLMFIIMCVAVSLFIGLLYLIGVINRGVRRFTEGTSNRSTGRPTSVRSRVLRSKAANAVQQRSALPNAENPPVQGVQQFTERSVPNAVPPANLTDLPATIEELQRLAHTIALYAKRPSKEVAILEAWGETKGDGEGYKRASQLFDTAMSEQARAAAKAKVPAAGKLETV